jgi:hypothetical protein
MTTDASRHLSAAAHQHIQAREHLLETRTALTRVSVLSAAAIAAQRVGNSDALRLRLAELLVVVEAGTQHFLRAASCLAAARRSTDGARSLLEDPAP